jgi:imidazolonepropionase-like amidohydrolase
MRIPIIIKTLGLAAIGLCLALPARAHPEDPAIVIRGRTIFTATRGTIENGMIVIRGGRILAIGKSLVIPEGARIIDASKDFVFPGFIDSGTNLGLIEFETVEKDSDETTSPVTPELRVIDAFDPENRLIPDARNQGTTSVLVAPGRGNLLSGRSALIHLEGGDVSRMIVKFPAAVHGSLGDIFKLRPDKKKVYPYTRMGAAALLRQTLSDARYGLDQLLFFEKKEKEDKRDAPEGAAMPSVSPTLRALFPVLKREMPLVITANRLDDILTALRIAGEFDVRLVINEGSDAYRARDQLAAMKVPVILRSRAAFRLTLETDKAVYENAALLQKAGVKIAFQTGSIQDLGDLLPQARLAVRYGVSPDDALKALTINPAEIFGAEGEVGSLETGKAADIVIFSGNPMVSPARLKTVIINGKIIEHRSTS